MSRLRLDRLIEFLTSTELFLGLLWAGLAAISITLLVLMRTRWGQSRPLRKCFVLSLLAHLLLAGYATTVQICSTGPRLWGEPTMRISLADEPTSDSPASDAPATEAPSQPKPWDQFAEPNVAESAFDGLAVAPPVETPPVAEPVRAEVPARQTVADVENLDRPSLSWLEEPKPDAVMQPAEPHPALARQPEKLDSPKAQHRDPEPLAVPVDEPADRHPGAADDDAPRRETQAGVPSPVVDASAPPRVAEEPDAQTGGLIRDVTDLPAAAPLGQPAQATAAPTASTSLGGSPATGSQAAGSPGPSGYSGSGPGTADGSSPLAATGAAAAPHAVPEAYRLRAAPDRQGEAQRRGATPQSEAAVREGLRWLAVNQEPDGRWDARRHGAGRETRIGGQDRGGSGVRADTGMTGLALLAFLAAGHTHQQGEYQDTVRRGLEFLIANQQANGCLSAGADKFAAMYCHAMAAFALSEAYGMTSDPRLAWPVRRAIDYIIAAQDPRGGGWRYSPSTPGDTSQLGWQLMALRSAELAGIPVAASTRNGALRFLTSVSHGRQGGLASYRPAERDTRPMTAEALVCRQLLGMPPESPTANEAADYLLGELPGDGPVNLYYWYYSTLGLYQVSGDYFSQWNEALQKSLVARQCDSGTLAGSWDPDDLWGSYGGRVYSTALATLCLEVYYRYVPRYVETAGRERIGP